MWVLAQAEWGWGLGIFMLFIGLAAFAFWLWALVDAIRNRALDSTMRIVWVVVIVVTQLLGALLYVIMRPKSASSS
jgi:uncharacterized membrane protein